MSELVERSKRSPKEGEIWTRIAPYAERVHSLVVIEERHHRGWIWVKPYPEGISVTVTRGDLGKPVQNEMEAIAWLTKL